MCQVLLTHWHCFNNAFVQVKKKEDYCFISHKILNHRVSKSLLTILRNLVSKSSGFPNKTSLKRDFSPYLWNGWTTPFKAEAQKPQQHSWNSANSETHRKEQQNFTTWLCSWCPEAHRATASGHTHSKDQEVFLEQQFQATSSERSSCYKRFCCSKRFKASFGVFFAEKKNLPKLKQTAERAKWLEEAHTCVSGPGGVWYICTGGTGAAVAGGWPCCSWGGVR